MWTRWDFLLSLSHKGKEILLKKQGKKRSKCLFQSKHSKFKISNLFITYITVLLWLNGQNPWETKRGGLRGVGYWGQGGTSLLLGWEVPIKRQLYSFPALWIKTCRGRRWKRYTNGKGAGTQAKHSILQPCFFPPSFSYLPSLLSFIFFSPQK